MCHHVLRFWKIGFGKDKTVATSLDDTRTSHNQVTTIPEWRKKSPPCGRCACVLAHAELQLEVAKRAATSLQRRLLNKARCLRCSEFDKRIVTAECRRVPLSGIAPGGCELHCQGVANLRLGSQKS